ncbi:MAG: nucleotidyltransferase domain-containing protein, partial [Acidobacteria bacterium]|nr:nucleotidyltransferase domain-containing protein [Acidobacteriota bacterium]
MDENYAVEMLPVSYRKDIQTAIDILKEEGCKEVYLFGSLVNGDFTGESDIDLAVKGLRKKFFFKTL